MMRALLHATLYAKYAVSIRYALGKYKYAVNGKRMEAYGKYTVSIGGGGGKCMEANIR